MHSFAHYALPISIATSAFGALLLCLLALRYDFTTGDDDVRETAWRRRFTTSLGHAAAVVCFALTGGMAAVVLAVQAGPAAAPVSSPFVSKAPAASTAVDLRPLTEDQARLRSDIERLGRRLAETEAALQRVAGENGRLLGKVRALERITLAARAPAPSPPSVSPTSSARSAAPTGPAASVSAKPSQGPAVTSGVSAATHRSSGASVPSAPSATGSTAATAPGRLPAGDSSDLARGRSRGVMEPASPVRRGEDEVQAASLRGDRRDSASALPRDVTVAGPESNPRPAMTSRASVMSAAVATPEDTAPPHVRAEERARRFAGEVQHFFVRVGRVLKQLAE
jgi:hypothetical protein